MSGRVCETLHGKFPYNHTCRVSQTLPDIRNNVDENNAKNIAKINKTDNIFISIPPLGIHKGQCLQRYLKL